MRKICLLILIIFSINFAFPNIQIQDIPKAIVSSEDINGETIQYSFISNYQIDDYKAPMLEGRMLNRYSEIISIQINPDSQIITFNTLKTDSELFLGKFVKHFNYSGYEIH